MEPQSSPPITPIVTPPPPRRSYVGFSIAGAILLIVLIVTGVTILAKYRPSAVPTATNFVEDIVAAQYIAAYIQTSSTFQAHESQAQFSKNEAGLTDITGVVSDVAVQSSPTSTEDIVTGQIQFSGAQHQAIDHFTIHAIWASHTWQIDSFEVN